MLYESSYHYFMEALVALAAESEEQCRLHEFVGVPWFLKDDFLGRTNILLNSPELKFSVAQLVDLGILLTLVGSLPRHVIDVPNEPQEQLTALANECWIPDRERARALTALLEQETERVNSILRGDR